MAERWIDRNPLRVWRKQHGMGYRRAQAALGMGSQTMIVYWEQGRSIPTPESFQNLAYKMGVSVRDLAGAWYEWFLSAKPGERQKRDVPAAGSVTANQEEVLAAVADVGEGATVAELVERTDMSRMWVERHLGALCAKGLVVRDDDLWCVTSAGLALVRAEE